VVEPFSESRSCIHQVSVELFKGKEGEEEEGKEEVEKEEEEGIDKSGLESLCCAVLCCALRNMIEVNDSRAPDTWKFDRDIT
jgi:hypothetical protein